MIISKAITSLVRSFRRLVRDRMGLRNFRLRHFIGDAAYPLAMKAF